MILAPVGVPLHADDGTHPGTLRLIDTMPHKFSPQDVGLPEDLCRWAELELKGCTS